MGKWTFVTEVVRLLWFYDHQLCHLHAFSNRFYCDRQTERASERTKEIASCPSHRLRHRHGFVWICKIQRIISNWLTVTLINGQTISIDWRDLPLLNAENVNRGTRNKTIESFCVVLFYTQNIYNNLNFSLLSLIIYNI